MQRAIDSIKFNTFVLLPQIFQNLFRYLLAVKRKQNHLEVLTDVLESLESLVPEHNGVSVLLEIFLVDFFIYYYVSDDAI